MAFIYRIVNTINGKSYIGKTSFSVESRMKEHIRDSIKDRCKDRPLYRAFNKYGVSRFEIECLEEVSNEESSEREIFWISFYDTFKHGYNATTGGDGKFLVDRISVVEAYKKTKSTKDTAETLGITEKTVVAIIREFNVERASKEERYRVQSKKVHQYSKEGEFLQAFCSASEASLNVLGKKDGHTHISRCCRGICNSAYGFIWKFEVS